MRLSLKTTKLKDNPLFINFLNWKRDKNTIEHLLLKILKDFEDAESKKAVEYRLQNLDDTFLKSLDTFQISFRHHIDQLIQYKEASEEFLMWLSNAFKYITEETKVYINDRYHSSKIKDPAGKWFEAVICYNFILTFNYFSSNIIKKCPICGAYFAHKGKYAKYCSDTCKAQGKPK